MNGEVSLGRVDRVDIAELVDAADESRRRRNPFGSVGPVLGGDVSCRIGESGMREEEAMEDRPEAVSDKEITFEIVRGIPALVV